MRLIFARKLRLKPSILTLFIFLTVPVLSTIIAVNYFSNDSSARTNARDLVERFRTDAIGSIQGDIDPIRSLIRSAASIGNQVPDFYSDDRSLRYFFSLLLHSDKIVSFYVGLEDGSFRQTRRVDPTVKIFDKLPPVGSRYAYRWV